MGDLLCSRRVALALLLAVPVCAFWSVLVLGERSFFVYPDNVQQYYVWYEKTASAMHNGYLPLWDANVDGGYSFVGETSTALFYPISLAFLALFGSSSGIPIRALEALIVLHYVVASVGMYYFCRQLGLSRGASAFAGILFSYTGPHAIRAIAQVAIFFTFSILPFTALAALLYAKSGRTRYALLTGALTGLEFLAGHIAAPVFSTLIAAAIFLGSPRERIRRTTVGSLAIVAIGTLVASPQLFFSIQHFMRSYRFAGAAVPLPANGKIPFEVTDQFSLHAQGLLSIFDPLHASGGVDGNSLWMGTVVLALVFLALVRPSVRVALRTYLKTWTTFFALAVLALLIAAGSSTPFARLWFAIPAIGTLVREPGRYGILFEFVFVIFAAVSLDALIRHPGNGSWSLRIGGGRLGYGCWLAVAGYAAYIFIRLPGVALASGILLVFCALAFLLPNPRLTAAAIVACGAVEAIWMSAAVPQPITLPTYALRTWAPSNVYDLPMACYGTCRVSIQDESVTPANLGDAYRLQTKFGYTALVDRPYLDFVASDWSDAGFVNDLLNIRYILTSKAIYGFNVVARDDSRGLLLYERPSAFPRVYSLTAAERRDLRLNDVRFSLLSYTDMRQEFSVTVPKGEVVVFSELFYPGWSVKLDGAPAPMLVTNVGMGTPILRAVRLPAGTHRVLFHYPL